MAQRSLTTARAMRWLGRQVSTRLRPLRDAGRWPLYLLRLLLGRPAGDYCYRFESWRPDGPSRVEVKLPAEGAGAVEPEAASAWCARQTLGCRRTLGELTAAGYDRSGKRLWQVDGRGPVGDIRGAAGDHGWFMAPGSLPELGPAFLESCLLVAAAERVDAVALLDHLPSMPEFDSASDLLASEPRAISLFSGLAYRYHPATDEVEPRTQNQVVKVITAGGEARRDRLAFHRRRRGPYLSSAGLPPLLPIGLRDVSTLPVSAMPGDSTGADLGSSCLPPGDKKRLLITAPFLARGGAEHTLLETTRALAQDFEITIATLAPHRPELGDRRDDFHQITDRIYCLGDLVHPAAMPGILGRLLDQLAIEILYNANGTTLFYEFFPRLKAERPGLRVVDHLYDHRIGYIDQYADPGLLAWIDACVAENRKIATVLVDELGWPPRRVPVIWPCGRSADAFPRDPAETRREVRRELGLDDSDLVFLTAARMHQQKRPLDLVALADRVRDLTGICFLMVGGGDLEAEVDAAIAAAGGAPVRRLPFRTDIPRLIAAADVGCLVSEHEGLPVFLLECLQAGRPFLGTDAGEMAAVLRETGAGLITGKPGDLDAIEAAVRRLNDPEVRGELARRAAGAGAGFDVESCAARYAEVFRG